MDKRIKYLVGLDTETCNGIIVNGQLDLSCSLVYDIGYQITDKQGRVYRQRSFVVREIFFGMHDVMKSAYYADKLPTYYKEIASGKRVVASLYEIKKTLENDMKEFNCNTIFAHNARFDYNALNNTIRYLTKSKTRYFFPFGCEIWDTLKMCRDVFGKMKAYRRFCENNGYMTAHKKPQTRFTAEVVYRFLTNNTEFVESHTGLEDVEIETEILRECFRQHKKMRKKLFED